MDVSIIIVNYNTRQLLADCLRSVFAQTKDIDFEVIISDNGSADGSIEMLKADFPQVILIENNANLGFGAANNRGLAVAKGKYIFYLNSDTILLNNAVKIFFDYWENAANKDEIGALGANLINKEGKIIHSYGEFEDCKNINKTISNLAHTVYGNYKLYLRYKLFHAAIPTIPADKHIEKHIGEVAYVTGADLFLRNDENARYDEHYFMYCEEMDLQYHLNSNGKKSFLIGGPSIIHLEGASCKKEEDVIRQEKTFSRINWRISKIYFLKKHGVSKCKILLLKLFTLLLWFNPLVFQSAKRHIRKLLVI